MYWLRRIPVETRIVVLVVFLALLQAILLSVFGLLAIGGERQQAEDRLHADARRFLVTNVSRRCFHALREAADAAMTAAFDEQRSDWRTSAGDHGLFTDAFVLDADGAVRSEAGALLWLPRDRHEVEQRIVDDEAARIRVDFRQSVIERAEKARQDLALATAHPFAADGYGGSLSLLLASSVVLSAGAEEPPSVDALLRSRWVGVLNGNSGSMGRDDVDRFLARIDAAGRDREGFLQGRAEQSRRASVLAVLLREKGSIPQRGPTALRANVVAETGPTFYRRHRRGGVQLLAVDEAALGKFLHAQLDLARVEAAQGVYPHITAGLPPAGKTDPAMALEGIPGWTATATISGQAILDGARGRERAYWYIIGFSVVGILAGGVLTARVVTREVKLAKLKAGFVSNVSHGLKTPLTSIRMFSDMLIAGQVESEEERRECLDVISQETNRLERLIQQVLDFGRLEARRRPFQWRTASLAPLVEREAERFRRAVGLDPDALTVDVAVNLPPATFDPDAFTEVVANLLSNAYKYSPADGRRIAVTLGPWRGRVVLAVEDNGVGVPVRERRKIFEQFYRVDDLLASEVEGTGLGLAIVHGIVRSHNGRIFVEDSTLGGSRFVVALPAAARAKKPAAPTPAESRS
ncbi:MAG: HAMP domain-containing histidine kinase [Planctomycetota bacterium]|nr:HAMP domain-containing histidine kinase [Planctomycetota bacterium]